MDTEMAVFDQAAFDKMAAHVCSVYPQEGCGILLGREGRRGIEDAVAVRNLLGPYQAGKHFLMNKN